VAKIIQNFGRTDKLGREQLARLWRSIGHACGKYLLACRMASVAEIKRDVFSTRGLVLGDKTFLFKSTCAFANEVSSDTRNIL